MAKWYIAYDKENYGYILCHKDCTHWNKADGFDGFSAQKLHEGLVLFSAGMCKHFPPRDLLTQLKLI